MMQNKAEKLIHDLRETGESWADLKGAAIVLEKENRNLRAKLINTSMARGSSKAKAEEEAWASEQHKRSIEALSEAQAAEVQARVAYDVAQAAIELYRTDAATRRVEIEHLNVVT